MFEESLLSCIVKSNVYQKELMKVETVGYILNPSNSMPNNNQDN
jgi:hypothetical protein